jgi:polyhydroxybutyrate depolymerase
MMRFDGFRGVDRVQRREHEVAGFGGRQRDFDGFAVSHFADEDDFWCLAERGTQRQRERGGIAVQLALMYRRLLVLVEELDWILDGKELSSALALYIVPRRASRFEEVAVRAFISAVVVALAAVAWPTRAEAQRRDVMSWTIDGEARRALVYLPAAATLASGRVPLVFSFHGHGDTADNYQHTDLHRAFPGAIVVYLQGLPSPRDGFPGWQTEKGQDNDRDLKAVDAALASLRQQYSIDDHRVYAMGFSNGAGLTFLLWAERPRAFAAFAVVAGRMRSSVLPQQPKPLLQIAGTRDRTIPFVAQEEAIAEARRINGAVAPVETWIHPGGHEYPDSTSERIAKFFLQHAAKLGS